MMLAFISEGMKQPGWYFILILFVCNFLLSTVLIYFALKFVHLKIPEKKKQCFFWLVSYATFVPGLGILMSLLLLILLKKFDKDFHAFEINTYSFTEYSRKNPISVNAHAGGWAKIRLESSQFNPEERKTALLSISRGLPQQVNKIYTELVSDSTEEIRVCAFSMLENQQDFIHAQINLLVKALEGVHEDHKKAFIAKQIALLYWELVYRNLSDQEFRQIVLDQSYHYANLALNICYDDATLIILIARIYLQKGQLNEAIKQFNTALHYKGPTSKIYPYLAEMAYYQKDYEQVRHYLNIDSSFSYIIKINQVLQFWKTL